jgi:hypothetical protein
MTDHVDVVMLVDGELAPEPGLAAPVFAALNQFRRPANGKSIFVEPQPRRLDRSLF